MMGMGKRDEGVCVCGGVLRTAGRGQGCHRRRTSLLQIMEMLIINISALIDLM